jgi:hypothetical protein
VASLTSVLRRHVLNVCGVGQHQSEIGVVQDVPMCQTGFQ